MVRSAIPAPGGGYNMLTRMIGYMWFVLVAALFFRTRQGREFREQLRTSTESVERQAATIRLLRLRLTATAACPQCRAILTESESEWPEVID